MIQGMNHFTILAEDRDATLAFYCGLLGLVDGPRPPFDFPGAWLYAPGGTQAVPGWNSTSTAPRRRSGGQAQRCHRRRLLGAPPRPRLAEASRTVAGPTRRPR